MEIDFFICFKVRRCEITIVTRKTNFAERKYYILHVFNLTVINFIVDLQIVTFSLNADSSRRNVVKII